MRVFDLLTAPWAIRLEVLQTMFDIYARHLHGEKPDLKAIEAAVGHPLRNEPKDYTVESGVAVLPIDGVLAKKMDLFSAISGGASTQRLQQQLAKALADDQVHSVILAVDSPGGEVDGVQALAADVFAAREGSKPIVAVADGVMASGAYWVASGAQEIYITGDTTAVGSIGVIAHHVDVSRAQEMRGVKVSDIVAGRYKAIASQNAPLSQEGRQSIQDILDHIYGIFVDEVARNRSVSSTTALEKMADGRLFLGQKAVQAGLVDGIMSLDAVVAKLNQAHASTAFARAAAAQPAKALPAVEPARPDESILERYARIERTAAQYVPPPPACITSRELLHGPTLKEPDPQEIAASARAIQAQLATRKIRVEITEAVRLARIRAGAERMPDDPEQQAAIRARLAQLKTGRDVGVDEAVRVVRREFQNETGGSNAYRG